MRLVEACMDNTCSGEPWQWYSLIRHRSGDRHQSHHSPSNALQLGRSMLLWDMAVLIPFPFKSERSSQYRSVHIIEGLTCPACEYEACSRADLRTHVQHKHAPASCGSDDLLFITRPSVAEDSQ